MSCGLTPSQNFDPKSNSVLISLLKCFLFVCFSHAMSTNTVPWQRRRHRWKCYNPEEKVFTLGGDTALRGKVSWLLGVKEYHKVILYNKPHRRHLLGEKNPGVWLPLLGWEATKNWAEDRVYIEFPEGMELSRVDISRVGLVGFKFLNLG